MNRHLPSPWPIVGVALLAGLTGCDRHGGEPILVGHLAVLSGPDRERGMAAQRGVQMAVEEVNADAKLWIGGKRVAVIHADTAGKLENYEKQAVRLAAINHVAALLGGLTRAQTNLIAPVAQDHKIILMTASGHTGAPPVEAVFSLGLSPAARVHAIENYLGGDWKPARVVVIADGSDSGMSAAADTLVDALRRKKLAVSLQLYAKAIELVEKSKSLDGAGIVFFGSATDSQSLNIKPEMLLFAGDEAESWRLKVGARYVAAYAPVATAGRKAFDEKYRKQFGEDALPDAERMYDAARTLFDAAREAKTFLAASLYEKLKERKGIEGLMGVFGFGADQTASGPAFLVEKTASGPVIRQTYSPEPAK